ncbi:hypothetical protein M514_01484, partial [Trichuris suis]
MDEAKSMIQLGAQLAARIDDIGAVFEKELFSSIQFTRNIVHRWDECYKENQALRSLVISYEKNIASMRQYHREVKEKLIEARSQIGSLVARKDAILRDKHLLEEQLSELRALLAESNSLSEESRKRLEALTSNTTSLSSAEPASDPSLADADFDLTDDSLFEEPVALQEQQNSGHVSRKRSNSLSHHDSSFPEARGDEQASSKHYKLDSSVKLKTENDGGMQIDPALSISNSSLGNSLNRRLSECGLQVGKAAVTKELSAFKSVSAISSPRRVLSKKHFFFPKTVFFGETCEVCSKRIGFAKVMLRCLDCGVKMHQQCRDNDFQNCVPRLPNFKCRRRLIDYIPSKEPFIPKMVIDLVNEIECRGLDYAGLYRVPGPESKVKTLLYKFLYERGYPNVRTISDVAVLTGCLKKFFQQLVEPLIPFTSRDEFMNIAVGDIGLRDQMKRIHKEIVELPLPNQHTLAFLLIHLQKVSERSETNKMPISNLARVFGPTIVGTFSQANISLSDMLNEAAKQEKVMTLLLSLPRQYLMQYIDTKKANRFRADDFDIPGASRDYCPPLTEDKTSTWNKKSKN